eukprot:2658143-Rhodomonas_salina.3
MKRQKSEGTGAPYASSVPHTVSHHTQGQYRTQYAQYCTPRKPHTPGQYCTEQATRAQSRTLYSTLR